MSENDKKSHVVKAAAATALAAYGFKKGGIVGTTVGIVGASITATEIAAAAGVSIVPSTPREVRQAIEVMASPEEAYEMWSRFEAFPTFMQNVIEVRKTGDRTWHWVVEGPLGQRIEWDAEVTVNEPGKFIGWRSTTADVDNNGAVRFEPTEHGTRVFVFMTFNQPAGPIGAVVAKVTGSDPQKMVRQDLRRFKQLIEAGEIARVVQLWKPEKQRLTEAIAQ
ncbi:MAG TPA: SRPBCC family protein [Blastocatellia bacterium]|nr:SRPBCC family protein [Blastocatellia bacterium]